MSKTAARRANAPDIIDIVTRYHAAINALDLAAVERFFAENPVYVSDGVAVCEGRDAVMAAFRTYFEEYGDQVSEDERMQAVSERGVRSVWKLKATSSKTGETLLRAGEETAFLDRDGFIEKVIVRDRSAANAA